MGWKAKVRFTPLLNRVRPKDHMGVLRKVLPARYSPLQANGNGIQSVNLTEIPEDFAEVLAGLIGEEARLLIGAPQKEIGPLVTFRRATISMSGTTDWSVESHSGVEAKVKR